jgi:hypothetical protein
LASKQAWFAAQPEPSYQNKFSLIRRPDALTSGFSCETGWGMLECL